MSVAWNDLSAEHQRGGGSYFNDAMRSIVREQPSSVPSLRNSRRLVAVSDFASEHSDSPFSSFSFAIMPVENLDRWNRDRKRLRKAFRLENRRIGYSKFTDRRKYAALRHSCACVNSLHGIVVTVVIDKRIESIFQPSGYFVPSQVVVGGQNFQSWKPFVLERAFRAAYFVALFVAGLSSPGQDVVWITDEDDIASNEATLGDLVRILGLFIGQLSSHTLGNVRIGTTASFVGDELLVEDLAAIPDLFGGAISELIASYGGDIPLYDFSHVGAGASESEAARSRRSSF